MEAILDIIENGGVTLEESVKLYKEGMELSKLCNENLQAVEKEVTVLQQAGGTYIQKPFKADME